MRFTHILRKNSGTEQPSQLVFLDTETTDKKLTRESKQAVLSFGWAAFTQHTSRQTWTEPEYVRFTSPEVFWNWALTKVRRKTKLYVVCHNAAFDFPVLESFRILKDHGYKLTKAIIEDPPTMFTFRKEGYTIVLLDNLNIYRMSLRELGNSFGLDKLKMPTKTSSSYEWDCYCRRDVDVMMQAFLYYLSVLKDWDLGNFSLTLPSQAFNAFRHRFMHHDILIDNNLEALKLSRSAYVGGRCEAFRIGKIEEPVHIYDVNAMYPYIMKTWPAPFRLRSVWSRVSVDQLKEALLTSCVVGDVEIKTDTPDYPIKHKGRMVFPVGKFRVTLADPELRHAALKDRIVKVYSLALYQAGYLFDEYVSFFYSKRLLAKEAGNSRDSFMCKLFMNSLYGKFGQNGRKWTRTGDANNEDISNWTEIDHNTKKKRYFRTFLGSFEELQSDPESRDSHPAIAAHITSAARLRLLELMELAGRKNVYYCDTDSLIVNDAGAIRLVSQVDFTELGKLKPEATAECCEIYGLKDYVFGSKTRMKGIRANAKRVGPRMFKQNMFRGYSGMLRDGDLNSVVISETVKTLKRVYTKGFVDSRGWVLPLFANEVVLPAILCDSCGKWSPFVATENVGVEQSRFAGGYVAETYIERDKPGKITRRHLWSLCSACSGSTLPEELQPWESYYQEP